jgi:cysteine desulfurase
MAQTTPIYLDNAATTPLDPEVLEAMMPYLTERFGNPSSIHAFGRTTRAAVERARKTVADALHASMGEIFFTSGGTESNNTALRCAVRDLGVTHVISSRIEHHCVEQTLEALAAEGRITLRFVGLRPDGHFDLEDLAGQLAQAPAGQTLVSLMHANNELGNLLDLDRVSALCREHGALLHSDTVQTVAHYALDVQRTPIDFLSGAAHKFHGPKGVGFLYVNAERHIGPLIRGGAQERNLRAGTENVAGIIGMARALDNAMTHLEAHAAHIRGLKRHFAEGLRAACPEVSFNGDWENGLYTVLNVHFPANGREDMLLFNLDIAGIAASGGSACSSGSDIGSHVVRAMLEAGGIERRGTDIRFSFSKYTTTDELDRAVAVIRESYAPRAVGAKA